MTETLDDLIGQIAACRICRDTPRRRPLPHEPRPVLRVSRTARIAICGQAPGTRVHASGVPFTDPSGERLRQWMGIGHETFYDRSLVAIVPMGFCFPGLDAKGGDLPPRPECAPQWRQRVLDQLPRIKLMLLVGSYAIKWHLGGEARTSLSDTVAAWRTWSEPAGTPPCRTFPLPHPSWRNTGWLKRNPWFETDLLPELRASIQEILNDT